MKIAVNATILDDMPTGLGIYTVNIVSQLAALGKELIVYTAYPEVFKDLNIEIRKVKSFVQPKYGLSAAIARFIWAQIVLPQMVIEDKVDLILNPTHHGALWISKPQIIVIHDLLPILFTKKYKLRYLYCKYILSALLKRSDTIVTVSQNSKKDICKYYHITPEKISVVYNACNRELFNYSAMDSRADERFVEGRYFLVVGASYEYKNIEAVLKSYCKIQDRINHRIAILGGRGKYVKSLKKKAKVLGIEKKVIFIPYVNSADLPLYYHRATALVFPSLYEGFGLPPLEAMACGCPTIVSNTSSLPEVCGQAAYCVDPYDNNSIAQGMLEVATNKTLRESLIQKGFNRIKLFSWEKTASQLYEIINMCNKSNTNQKIGCVKPEVLKSFSEKPQNLLFLPDNPERRSDGGLRKNAVLKRSLTDKPLVSIITAIFNGKKAIEKTIQSVLNQTYDNIEYIIIDGGSTDGTLDIIKNYEAKIDYWLSEPDNGVSDAFNKGIALAKGDYIQIINADDWLSLDQIEIAVYNLSNSSCHFVYGDAVFHDEESRELFVNKGESNYKKKIRREMPSLNHPSILAKRQIYLKIGGFNLDYKIAMDYEWLLKATIAGFNGKYISGLVSHVSRGGLSDSKFISAHREVLNISLKYDYNLPLAYLHFFYRITRGKIRRLLEPVLPLGIRQKIIEKLKKYL